MHTKDGELAAYTTETLDSFKRSIEVVRADMLFGVDLDSGSDADSEQYFLLVITALEQASRFLVLASLKQTRGLVR